MDSNAIRSAVSTSSAAASGSHPTSNTASTPVPASANTTPEATFTDGDVDGDGPPVNGTMGIMAGTSGVATTTTMARTSCEQARGASLSTTPDSGATSSAITIAGTTPRAATAMTTNTAPTPTRRYYPALAYAASTPSCAKLLLPLLCIFCHAIFYYGQTEPMWKLHVNATIDVWANATEYTARRTFDVLGLDYEIPLRFNEEEDVQTFTYYFAIHELWEAKDLPGTIIPRLAAILLIVFSGIWPHLKLFMLNLTWFFGKHPIRRTRALQLLSGLGKWSLADVLVVCVMVGVLHLDWVVDPADIKQGLITDLPSIIQIIQSLYNAEQLCDKALKMDCVTQKRVANIAKCKACKGLINEAYTHPEWAGSTGKKILDGVSTSGGGLATLRVVGMRGIYAFCGAVILSILLSLVVDVFDVKAKAVARLGEDNLAAGSRGLLEGERPIRRLLPAPSSSSTANNNVNNEGLEEPLLGDSSAISATNSLEIEVGGDDRESDIGGSHENLFSFRFLLMSLAVAFVIFMAGDLFTMERLVHGAGPQLLSDILGVHWEKLYSLRSLMWTTGASGGWDNMLMATFGLFCVLGPCVRAVLLVLMVLLDQFKVPVSFLATSVSFLGSFCSWEVFAIAIVMVQMLMPTITNTIVQNPVCGKISSDGSCLTVEFNVIALPFLTILLGGFMLVGMTWSATARANWHGQSSAGITTTTTVRGYSTVSRVMAPNHNYQRLRDVDEGSSDDVEGGLDELVFETNQL